LERLKNNSKLDRLKPTYAILESVVSNPCVQEFNKSPEIVGLFESNMEPTFLSNGVGILTSPRLSASMLEFSPVSKMVASLRLQIAGEKVLTVVCAYAQPRILESSSSVLFIKRFNTSHS